jgi:hypothetical protein
VVFEESQVWESSISNGGMGGKDNISHWSLDHELVTL